MKGITIYRRGVLVAALFSVIVWALISVNADRIAQLAIWTLVITTSVLAIARKIRKRNEGSYSSTDVLPDALRRWMLDESKEPKQP